MRNCLGSAYATTDASGNVVGEMRYYAFGETRLSTGNMFTDRLYTGQRYIAELGVYHYNARFYSPKLGRFLSADTLMSGFANPQGLNRFSYVANNPVRYTDPTGRCFIELSSHMVWFSDSDPKCGGSYTPTNDGGGGGGSDDEGGGGGGDEDENGHYYQTENVVCPATFDCTAEEMQQYAAMFQYPGQNPSYPVQNGGIYFVAPAPQLAMYSGNLALLYSGAITVEIRNDGLTLINRTLPTHIFHDGLAERTYSQREDGAWVVTTTGIGTNVWPLIGPEIDLANEIVGPPVFTAVDAQMLAYITSDQILSGTFPRWEIP